MPQLLNVTGTIGSGYFRRNVGAILSQSKLPWLNLDSKLILQSGNGCGLKMYK